MLPIPKILGAVGVNWHLEISIAIELPDGTDTTPPRLAPRQSLLWSFLEGLPHLSYLGESSSMEFTRSPESHHTLLLVGLKPPPPLHIPAHFSWDCMPPENGFSSCMGLIYAAITKTRQLLSSG